MALSYSEPRCGSCGLPYAARAYLGYKNGTSDRGFLVPLFGHRSSMDLLRRHWLHGMLHSTHLPRLRCSEGFWKLERAWRVCMLRKVVLCTRPVWVCEFLSCWTVWTSISIGSTPIVGTTLLRNHYRACSILSLLLLIFKCAYHGLWAHVGSFVLRAVCARYCAVYAIPSVAMCQSTCQVGTSATFRLYDTSTALNCTITP